MITSLMCKEGGVIIKRINEACRYRYILMERRTSIEKSLMCFI